MMEYKKTAEATADFNGNKIVNTITKVSKSSAQNNSETITNEHDKEIPNERCIYRKKKKKRKKTPER